MPRRRLQNVQGIRAADGTVRVMNYVVEHDLWSTVRPEPVDSRQGPTVRSIREVSHASIYSSVVINPDAPSVFYLFTGGMGDTIYGGTVPMSRRDTNLTSGNRIPYTEFRCHKVRFRMLAMTPSRFLRAGLCYKPTQEDMNGIVSNGLFQLQIRAYTALSCALSSRATEGVVQSTETNEWPTADLLGAIEIPLFDSGRDEPRFPFTIRQDEALVGELVFSGPFRLTGPVLCTVYLDGVSLNNVQ